MSCDLASVEVDLGLELDAVAAHVRRLHVVQRSTTSVSRGFISVLIALVPGYNEQLHSKKSAHWRRFDVIKWPMTGGFTIKGRNSRRRDTSPGTGPCGPKIQFHRKSSTGNSPRGLENNPPHIEITTSPHNISQQVLIECKIYLNASGYTPVE